MPASTAPDLAVENLCVDFGPSVHALANAGLNVPGGALCGIAGPSGSGKTTLLHALAGLLRPNSGTVRWGETTLTTLNESACDAWRRTQLGFVFQDFHLVPELTAAENVLLPQSFSHIRLPSNAAKRAETLLADMAIPDQRRRAALLSRGEQQRVAIARALFADPPILLADEPTASLDAASAAAVADLLLAAAKSRGATLLIVSHDPELLARLNTIHRIDKGVLT